MSREKLHIVPRPENESGALSRLGRAARDADMHESSALQEVATGKPISAGFVSFTIDTVINLLDRTRKEGKILDREKAGAEKEIRAFIRQPDILAALRDECGGIYGEMDFLLSNNKSNLGGNITAATALRWVHIFDRIQHIESALGIDIASTYQPDQWMYPQKERRSDTTKRSAYELKRRYAAERPVLIKNMLGASAADIRHELAYQTGEEKTDSRYVIPSEDTPFRAYKNALEILRTANQSGISVESEQKQLEDLAPAAYESAAKDYLARFEKANVDLSDYISHWPDIVARCATDSQVALWQRFIGVAEKHIGKLAENSEQGFADYADELRKNLIEVRKKTLRMIV